MDPLLYYGDEDVVYDTEDFTPLLGDGNNLPVVSDVNPSKEPSLLQLLGSLGQTAKDLGTAVGTVQKNVRDAKGNYTQARQAAASGNSLGTWWQYASTTDKLMVGLAVAGLVLVLVKD